MFTVTSISLAFIAHASRESYALTLQIVLFIDVCNNIAMQFLS